MPPDSDPQGVYLVIPVHNRREITMECLRHLREIGVLGWAKIIVVDDGSTDGTDEAIREQHPEIILMHGDGNLWWTGAIVTGMKAAVKRGAKIIVWLNDDCLPRAGTLKLLCENSANKGCISVGQTLTSVGQYGGHVKTAWGLKSGFCPPSTTMLCDSMAGNCVAMPAGLVRDIGYPDAKRFPHVLGDCDYGLRAKAARCEIIVLGDALCDSIPTPNKDANSWLLSERTFREHWTSMLRVRSGLYPPARWHFNLKYWGAWGLVLFAGPYAKFFVYQFLKLLVPRKMLKSMFGHHSIAWRTMEELEKKPWKSSK